MLTNLRYWLASHLLVWSIKMIPERGMRECMTYGINIGIDLATGRATLIPMEEEDKPSVH